jgi:arylformamidase
MRHIADGANQPIRLSRCARFGVKEASMARIVLVALACVALALSAGTASREIRSGDKQALSYGPDPLQGVDYWAGPSPDAPLVVFVHGGGWSRGDKRMMDGSHKLEHWRARGYAVASINYRLVPDATVEQQAADVAGAVALLKARSGQLGFNPRKIALVGHSAGAHLVALVGTDEQYLRAAGLSFADIAGVVPLDGAAFDATTYAGTATIFTGRMFKQAFGDDPARQARLSPILQAGAPNAAHFAILHIDRPDSRRQSGQLAAALASAGSDVELEGFAGRGLRGHAEINRRMGDPGYPATRVLDAFLARVFS